MKKTVKIQSNGFYILTGRSNANSCFIEKLKHAKTFLIYANFFLRNYLSIYDYIVTKDGWSMVVKIKHKKQLKEISRNKETEVWKIISERVRLFLSTFVRVTNKDKGRTGCLVHSGYERYYFENKKEAMSYLEKIRKQQIKFYSRKKKYRSLKTHYQISKLIGQGSIFLCSKDIRKEVNRNLEFAEVLEFNDLTSLVVEKFINLTLKHHSPLQIPSPPT